jgi:HAE1 family hydrophobic/amphiphilic exporter-1
MVALMLFGWVGFKGMGISQLPDVDFPVVTVNVTWEGAAPEVMETEVTDTIEDSVMQVQGVKEVTSTSKQGAASITIEFELNRDIDAALQEVQTRIAQAQKTLPKDIDPPIVTKSNPEDQPIIWLALSGDRDLAFMMRYTKDELKDQFTTVPGVGEVQLGGYVEPNLRVWLDADKMQARELTVSDISNAITNQHSEVPAGFLDTGAEEMNVRVMGEASSVKEFENIIIPSRAGAPIWSRFRIKDVATVEDALDDIRRISRVNGQPAVGIGIKKQRGSNAVAIADAVKKKMDELQPQLPKGLKLGINFDRTKFIKQSTHDLTHELVMAGLLTAFVCFLFLGSFSSAINIILAIPTSVLGAFMVLYFFGFTLNTFTLLGLTLVIGIIVDDAIMVLENIVRHQEMGESRVKAAIVGARQITPAAVAASVAILAIFVPVVFMQGIIGKFFFQFGITISAAVMLSLLEALTLAPMRCSQFLSIHNENWLSRNVNRIMRGLTRSYTRGLTFSLNHWILVLFASLVFFAGSLFITKFLKKEFVPPQDQSSLFVRLQTPAGSSIEFTDKVFREAEKRLMARPEVLRYYAAIGGFGGGDVNSGILFVTLKDKQDRPIDPDKKRALSQQELMPVLRKEMASIPGMYRAIIQDLSLSGFTSKRGFPIEFILTGNDWDKMGALSEQLMKKMEDSGYMTDVDSNYLIGQPEVRVLPNREKAAQRGVSVAEIGNTINAMIGGIRVGKYTKNGRRYDIRIRLAEADRRAPTDIKKIWVRNSSGQVIRLSDVVDIVQKKTLVSVSRENRERAITMYANIAAGKSQNDAIDKLKQIAKETLPDGYHIQLTGGSKTSEESSNALFITFALGILVAYMVLGSQYNSFIHPIVVLMALPFSVTGAFIALWLGGQSINLYSMIGLILLMGIVKKNAILLVDFTNELRKEGVGVRAALLQACPIRLRPIIMTSIATISAAVPTALGLGAGSETRVPMALVIIGGVAVSTFLTLFVVPAFYLFMSRFESTKHEEDLKEALQELGENPGA